MPDLTLFTAGGRAFTAQEATDFAGRRGLLDAVREETREALACRQYAEELGFELEDGQLQSAVEQWRRGHELTSAQDTLTWLERHGLAREDLADYFEAALWRARFMQERRRIAAEYDPEPEEVASRQGSFLAFSWRLEDFAALLARPAAAFLERHGSLPALPWPELLAALEQAAAELRAGVTRDEHCRRELALSRLDLLRVEYEAASFATPGEAREALLCVRDDGEDLAAVCARAQSRALHECRFAEDLPAGLRERCLSAFPGCAFLLEDPPRLVRVLRKDEPDLADPAVRRRVGERLEEAAFAPLVQRHIRWVGR